MYVYMYMYMLYDKDFEIATIYICMYIYIYIYISIQVYVYMYMYMCTFICIQYRVKSLGPTLYKGYVRTLNHGLTRFQTSNSPELQGLLALRKI